MTWVDDVAVGLDPVVRARALAASIPGAGWQEAVFDVPFDRAWPLIADLETSVPAADPFVRRLEIRERRPTGDGAELLRFTTWSPVRVLPAQRFTARMEDGFCLMRNVGRLFVVVMAASPEGEERTRFFHCEAVPRRGARPLRRLMQRNVGIDVEGFERLVRAANA